MASGALVLVVGPSGVGKDTLIAGAKLALDANPRFVFVRRVVTREAHIEVEDHASMDLEAFRHAEAAGDFSLSWEAHGLHYALPVAVDTDIALGRIVVANVSRHVVARARDKYPACAVLLIGAEVSQRAERLARRGRESQNDIAARLAREGAPVPPDITPIVIDNSGSLAAGVERFIAALHAIAGQ